MVNAMPVGDLNGSTSNAAISPTPFMSPTSAIGGTSGGGDNIGASSNILSMNLGGVNVNYDMGPSTGDLATQAYNFLGNSFNADSALLGNTIAGSQAYVSGFAAPVEAMASDQQNFNTQVLPSMFGTLSSQNYSLGTQAVNAEADVATASVNASSASASEAQQGGGGLCFITTAVCEYRGEADDGPTLTKLRGFRDSYMMANPRRKELVRLYYQTAPDLVIRIKERSDAAAFCDQLYRDYLKPACDAIDRGDNLNAFTYYTLMLGHVRQEA
jgi:hypothetical protein